MKTDKEYPATHSMWTAWFAIDIDGNVAIMECDDNGPAPIEAPKDETSDSLLLETLTDSENRIKYTDEQLLLMMKSSITPKEYTRDDYNFENIWGNICQINPEKLPLLKEAAAQNSENVLICLSENLNLWYVSFSIPHYLDNSGDSRYRPTKERVEENKNAKRLYKKIFDDLMRIVPEAVSYRSHSLTTSSGLIAYAAQKGLRFDLNNYVQITGGGYSITPYKRNDILIVPFIFEDDLWLEDTGRKSISYYLSDEFNLLRIFNFHPIQLYLNCENIERYNSAKQYNWDLGKLEAYRNRDGYGMQNVFLELIRKIKEMKLEMGLIKELGRKYEGSNNWKNTNIVEQFKTFGK